MSAEIGYFIGEPYWNKGIVTTAVNLITEYGFQHLGIVRIQTGVFRKSDIKQGKLWDEVRYAKLKTGIE